jgi:hypothetical protein
VALLKAYIRPESLQVSLVHPPIEPSLVHVLDGERGLKRGPEALGYETGLWTAWRVAHWIEQECGVRYYTSQAWRILRQLGWSCQRPVGRALERDDAKIRRWKQERWPELKKSRKRRANHRLHRRKRAERTATPLPYWGAEGKNPRAAIPL